MSHRWMLFIEHSDILMFGQVYNSNYDMYGLIKFWFEFSPAGFVYVGKVPWVRMGHHDA